MGPVLEHDISRNAPQVLEAAVCGAACGARGTPGENGAVGGGMEGEGESVEADEDAGEGFLAVSDVVLEVVSVALEHGASFVFDLPSCPTAGGEFGNPIGGHRKIGEEAVIVGPLPGVVADLDAERGAQWYRR